MSGSSPLDRQTSVPTTPDLLSRALQVSGQYPSTYGSPASSTASEGILRLSSASRSSFRGILSTTATPIGTPGRKTAVRSDPILVTCFDPADKELYDLWAPKT